MAVYFFTKRPARLLSAFDARINQTAPFGRVDNWVKADDGLSYTLVPIDWNGKASMVPCLEEDRLTFNIVGSNGWRASSVVYAFYHSQLVHAFLRNLDLFFEGTTLTGRCAAGDDSRLRASGSAIAAARDAYSDEAGHAFRKGAGHLFRSEAGGRSDLMSVTFDGDRSGLVYGSQVLGAGQEAQPIFVG